MAREPLPLDLAERAKRLAERDLRVRPVQQQEIDLGEPQPHQAVLGGPFELARRKMRGPDLGGDEHLLALDARGAQPLADFALVVVHLRGIDVAVAEPQRLLDQPCAGAPAQVPGAETDQRDARAMGFDHLHDRILRLPVRTGRILITARRQGHGAGRSTVFCSRSGSIGSDQLSHCGACGGLTTRPSERLSLPISAISASLNVKSKTARLAARWPGLAVRGIGMMPCCTR